MCAQNTPCLDDSNQCTQRCVPLAAAFCKGICPNALEYVPSDNPVAAAAPDLSTLSGAALTQAYVWPPLMHSSVNSLNPV